MDLQKLKDAYAIFASTPIPEIEQIGLDFRLNPVVPKGEVWILSKDDIFPPLIDLCVPDSPKPLIRSYLVDYGIPILPHAMSIIGFAESAYKPHLTVKEKILMTRRRMQKARIRRKIMPFPSC